MNPNRHYFCVKNPFDEALDVGKGAYEFGLRVQPAFFAALVVLEYPIVCTSRYEHETSLDLLFNPACLKNAFGVVSEGYPAASTY